MGGYNGSSPLLSPIQVNSIGLSTHMFGSDSGVELLAIPAGLFFIVGIVAAMFLLI